MQFEERRLRIRSILTGLAASLAVLLVVIPFLYAQLQQNTRDLENATQTQLRETSRHLEQVMGEYLRVLELMRIDLEQNPEPVAGHFEEEAETALGIYPVFQAVNWLSTTGEILIVRPETGNRAALGGNVLDVPNAAPAFRRALATGKASQSNVLELMQGGVGFTVYLPVRDEGNSIGVINGVFRIDGIFSQFIGEDFNERYVLRVFTSDELIYTNTPKSALDENLNVVASEDVVLAGEPWSLELVPRKQGAMSFLEQFLGSLLAAAVIALLVGVLVGAASERRRRLRLSEARFRDLAGLLPDMVAEADSDFDILYLNALARNELGYTKEKLEQGVNLLNILVRDEMRETLREDIRRTRHGRSLVQIHRVLCADGSFTSCEVTLGPIEDDSGKFRGVRCVLRDISAHLAAEREIRRVASTDPLTELPNRNMFREILRYETRQALASEQTLMLMMLDFNHFKDINERLGHAHGDALLREAGHRLESLFEESVYVARLGGDEFALLFSDNVQADRIDEIATAVSVELRRPYELGPGAVEQLAVSIGIALLPDDASNDEQLLMYADAARYEAKARGGKGIERFTPDISRQLHERKRREGELRVALERNEFELYYQPFIDVGRNRIVGAEALIRWNHPEQGVLGPYEFIPIAEETGLINDIGAWSINEACRELAAWHAEGYADLHVSVNVSARQLDHVRLGEVVSHAMQKHGIADNHLWLEITESLLMEDVDVATRTLQHLKSLGCCIAVDDFGTGYSSLAYLNRLPLDVLKIDRSFVAPTAKAGGDTRVTDSIIALARSLNLATVAEGVESATQKDYLLSRGCENMQGFMFSRPIPARQFRVFMADWQNVRNARNG